MPVFTRLFQPLIRSVVLLSAITISSVHAADKIDLIIDTDLVQMMSSRYCWRWPRPSS